MFVIIRRILKFGFLDFWRNKGLSFQVIFIMVIAVGTFASLFLFRSVSDFLLERLQEKVDISIYFKKETPPDEISAIKNALENFSSDIEKVTYVSPQKARDIFVQRHQNDPLYLNALNEIGENPFLPSLNVVSKNPAIYAQISEYISSLPFSDFVKKVSYYENKRIIERFMAFSSALKKAGIVLSVFFVVLVFLITFNTVKLTIFAQKEEISTMRLVGASNWFVRGPFFVQGIIYAVFSVLIVNIIFLSVFYFTQTTLQNWFLGFNFFDYFLNHFFKILTWQILFAFSLALISSFFAVKKYLKV